MSLRVTLGNRSCAEATQLINNKQRDKNNLFISFSYNRLQKYEKKAILQRGGLANSNNKDDFEEVF